MKIAVLKERGNEESRVAATPDSVKKFRSLGFDVSVEKGAGLASSIPDSAYQDIGATVADAVACCSGADIVLKVNRPTPEELGSIPSGILLIGMLSPHDGGFDAYASKNITAFSMELLPRISRAQAMDVLSSQSNLAGYRAVIEAFALLGKAAPMMMTAAGTVLPAKALVLGAGVAGLQAIATAKRMGAVVSAFDVRPAVKEQVESLGAKFIEVPSEESGDAAGGYAKEMSEEYKKKQAVLVTEHVGKSDLVITTALIPGKPAPKLISEEAVNGMKPGSVIVDLAASAGGNCAFTKPGQVADSHGVHIIGYTNLPSRVAADASQLYARNLYNFVALMVKDKQLQVPWDDEIIKATIVAKDGKATR